MGAAQGRLLDWLEALELFLYRRANRIVAVTAFFKKNLAERGIDEEKIDVVTNSVDTSRINPSRVHFNARRRLGISNDTFLVGYIGTTGMAHGLETLLDAAKLCQDDKLHFLILGQGARRSWLESRAQELGLDNVTFRNSVAHDQIPSYYATLDAALVHLRPDPLFLTVIPSKIFECMAMGTPILMAVEGEAAQIVADARCGLCVPSGDSVEIAQAAQQLAEHREATAEMGARGQDAANARFNRRVKALEMLDAMIRVCPEKREAPAISMSSDGNASRLPGNPRPTSFPARRAA